MPTTGISRSSAPPPRAPNTPGRGTNSLTAEHGFPLRLVVPHLYGYKGPKWLRALEYMTGDRRGFWEERGYHNIADPWAEQRHSYQEEDPAVR